MVDLTDDTCTCKKFLLETFPFEHVVVVAMYREFAARTLCSHYYTTDYWRVAYPETIFPLSNEVEWEVSDHIHSLNTLLPPLIEPRGPGYPSTSRILSTGEFSRQCKYSRCKSVEHTRQYCTSHVLLNDI
ncbi:uncharacterized protein LOC111390097 [Olea europaea var. sylvestris]|uniref:uncharacterized protein LOC111390097 n=1 Tax=Olea europaea var. sylvestris TaxID=158386 RepID=UPI000C1D5CF2|nr:uncharacterized protein LOC111390097 [Olea europaea var. sylvestris]